METVEAKNNWIEKIVPDGLPPGSTTIITGPGGSGKPLIGEAFVSSWLKCGGSVIFMSLQYPDTRFVSESIKQVSGIDLENYKEKTVFLQLDTEISGYQIINDQLIHANLVKPEIWEKVLNIASEKLPEEGPGILIFCSALNLLLFSPTYGEAILEKIKKTLVENTSKTFLISVSTSAKVDEIKQLEEIADNLILSHSEKQPFRLFIKIIRMKERSFNPEEFWVPISTETLTHMKKMAGHSKNKILPAISGI